MKKHLITTMAILCAMLCWDGHATPEADEVKAEATVTRYIPRAIHWHYEDGGADVWSGVELRMTAPKEWQGTNVTIYLSIANTNTVFKTPGTRLSFRINRKYLITDPDDSNRSNVSRPLPFEGALIDLKEIHKPVVPIDPENRDQPIRPKADCAPSAPMCTGAIAVIRFYPRQRNWG